MKSWENNGTDENGLVTPPSGLTHGGRVTHICVSKLTIIGSDNGLSPERRQAIIWTNAGIVLIRTLGTNFSEISSEIHTFSFKKMHLKMSSAKWRPFCLGLNALKQRRGSMVCASYLYRQQNPQDNPQHPDSCHRSELHHPGTDSKFLVQPWTRQYPLPPHRHPGRGLYPLCCEEMGDI